MKRFLTAEEKLNEVKSFFSEEGLQIENISSSDKVKTLINKLAYRQVMLRELKFDLGKIAEELRPYVKFRGNSI